MSTMFGVVVYNKNLVPPDRAPKQWDDLLKPEWKGRKMMAEIRVNTMAAFVPAKGEQWVKDYAAGIAAQQPIWARGQTAALTRIAAGEFPLHSLNYYEAAYALQKKGSDSLEIAVLDPIPTYPNVVLGVQKGSKRPYTALLFLEYVAGPEGQRIMDEVEIAKGSIYGPGTILNKAAAGKKLSEVGWAEFAKMAAWEQMATAAYGFPKAE
jgi:iron(III) transport system substrate-binding protein